MIMVALLIAAAVQAPQAASPAQVAEARAHLRRQAEANRRALEDAIRQRLLDSGYFQMVTGRAEQRSVVAGFERRLRSIGIQATIGKCDWMGLVAEGVKGGNLSYGAACRVRIASRSPADFLICEASLGGISLTKPDVYSWGADYIELYIRRACF
jgi:hypothetical protein